MPVLPQTATIKVDGAPIDQRLLDQLVEARVESSVGVAGHFTLRFLSDDGLDAAFKIGDQIQLAFDDERLEPVEVFRGTVQAMSIDYEFDRRQLTISGYDGQHKIGTQPVTLAHVDSSYGDIVNKIAGAAGLNADVGALDDTTYDHVLQLESDLAFVHRIVSSRGLEWFVDDAAGKLVVRKRSNASTIKVEFGERLRRLSARYSSAERPESVDVRGWDPADKTATVATSTRSAADPVGKVRVEERSRSAIAAGRRGVSWGAVTTSPRDAETTADGYARRMASGDLVGRGEMLGDPNVKPGTLLDVAGVDDDWNGTYYVTAVEHVFGRFEPYLTRFTIGANDTSSLVDLLGAPGTPSAGSSPSAQAFGQGVTIGVVTNVENSERKHAEVKVTFPYLDSVESGWARVASPGAGKDRGIMFMPEVNDEVLVAFEHGDPRRPYVIGAVWNGKDTPPLDPTHEKQGKQRAIVSRTGHRMTFSDGGSDDDLYVSIVLDDEQTTLMLGRSKIEIIANSGKPIEIKNDKAKVVLAGNGDITLDGNNVTIKAKQKISLDGAEISTKAKAKTAIDGGGQLQMKASGQATLDGGGATMIKGGMVKVN